MPDWLTALADPETAALAVAAATTIGLILRAVVRSFREGKDAAPAATGTVERAIGAGIAGGLDGAKIGEGLERIAEAQERIADGVASIAASAATIARLEEQGTAQALERQGQMIGGIAEQLQRLTARGMEGMRRD